MKTERQDNVFQSTFSAHRLFANSAAGQERNLGSQTLLDTSTGNGVFAPQQQPSRVMAAIQGLRRPSAQYRAPNAPSQSLVPRGSAGPQSGWIDGLRTGIVAAARDLFASGPSANERRREQLSKLWTELQEFYEEWGGQPRTEPTSYVFVLRANGHLEKLAEMERKVKADAHTVVPGAFEHIVELRPLTPDEKRFVQDLSAVRETVKQWLFVTAKETDTALSKALLDEISTLQTAASASSVPERFLPLIHLRGEIEEYVFLSPRHKADLVARIDSVVRQ